MSKVCQAKRWWESQMLIILVLSVALSINNIPTVLSSIEHDVSNQ